MSLTPSETPRSVVDAQVVETETTYDNWSGKRILSCTAIERESRQRIAGLPCAGLQLNPGDTIRVTVEVIKPLPPGLPRTGTLMVDEVGYLNPPAVSDQAEN